MKKFLSLILSVVAFAAVLLAPAKSFAGATDAGKGLNAANYLLYNSTSVNTVTWVGMLNQPKNTVHRISVKDTSGSVMELAYGADAFHLTHLLYVGPGLSASAETVVYPIGLSFAGAASSVWIRAVSHDATVGENVINFMY